MIQTLRANSGFLLPYLFILLVSTPLLLLYDKGELHLLINKNQSGILSYFFVYITHLGDGITALALVLLLCFFKFRSALLILFSYAISSGITQWLKRVVFPDTLRPKSFFEGSDELWLIPGVENHSYNSFPSGHAATAFCIFLCLALISNRSFIKTFLLSIALLVAFSRVYISQHFLGDIVAGSAIGTVSSLIVYQYLINSKRAQKIKWLDRSLTGL